MHRDRMKLTVFLSTTRTSLLAPICGRRRRAASQRNPAYDPARREYAAMLHEKLTPPETKPHVSVARLRRFWYVACQSAELGRKPLARTVVGVPLVLFRDAGGKPAALLDRCPHRNVPLSLGRVVAGGRLECAYHGWQFEPGGRCSLVPGLLVSDGRERRAPAAAVREQGGLVWVYPELDESPDSEPFSWSPTASEYARVVREVETDA